MLEKIVVGEVDSVTFLIDFCNFIFELLSEILGNKAYGIMLTKPSGRTVHVLVHNISDVELDTIVKALEDVVSATEAPLEIGKFKVMPISGNLSNYGYMFVSDLSEHETYLVEKTCAVLSKFTELLGTVDFYVIDPSTGLPGKKYLENRIDEQIQRKIRYGENFSLIVMKLENYDEVLKNRSEESAEALMREIARFLLKIKRKSDIISRLDVDKFAILVPHTTASGTESFVERLQSTMDFETFHVNNENITCNFQIGFINSENCNFLEHDEILLNAMINLGGKTKQSQQKQSGFSFEIVGDSEKIRECKREILIAAQTDMTVLVLGETGTGKELVAKKIHELSARREKPFLIIDCASIPESLLESELFGYEKGAFTGATSRKIGLFESAEGGTVFLDEIEATAPSMQAKLLRAIEEKVIRRVGGTEFIPINVRIISASNIDLEEAVKKGDFRKDLYYRISGMTIKLPPLRERKSDIPQLITYFVKKYSIEQGKIIKGVAPAVFEAFQSYDWPGNVRELEKEIERLIAYTEDGSYITEDDVSNKILPFMKHTFTLNELVENYEKNILIDALINCNWNESKAAKMLGISRTSLISKIKKYYLRKPSGSYSKN